MYCAEIVMPKYMPEGLKSDPWACPPLNLWNWNLAWMWHPHAMESAPSTLWMSVVGVRELETKLQPGHLYQIVRNNR